MTSAAADTAAGQEIWADAADEPEEAAGTAAEIPEITRRRLAPTMPSSAVGWIATAVIGVIAAVLRLVGLSHPQEKIFDEIYYASEGHQLFQHGVEWNYTTHTGDFVVHPPLGKWLIGLGEATVAGLSHLAHHQVAPDSFGWRIAPAIAGIIAVLLTVRIGRRMFRSNMLAAAAGLLMAMDGMELVLSRSALLDIFLLMFLLAAFACLAADRDQRRRGWLKLLESGWDPRAPGAWLTARPPWPGGVPWWRIAAAAMTGCAMAVKWSAIWYVPAFLLLLYWWEAGARRSAGLDRPWGGALFSQTGWVMAYLGIFAVVYLASWTGWFVTSTGWDRNWMAVNGYHPTPIVGPVLDPLINLLHYHLDALNFHDHLTTPHRYQSWPWQWLLLGRPVAFYWSSAGPCGSASCASEVLLLGTPVLWWAFIPALFGLAWFGISRRDWRAGTLGLLVAVGIVPWFWWEVSDRTMFYFYALPAEPFLILAVVYVLGAIMRPAFGVAGNWLTRADRRVIGGVLTAVFLLAVTACFFYFYPIYVGKVITYNQWWARMWLGGRWV